MLVFQFSNLEKVENFVFFRCWAEATGQSDKKSGQESVNKQTSGHSTLLRVDFTNILWVFAQVGLYYFLAYDTKFTA